MTTQMINTLGKRWWLVAAGKEGRAWNLFQAERCLAHDGAGLGDLRAFRTKREIEQAMARLDPTGQRPVNHALGSWQTLHDMAEGHIVLAKEGRHTLLGVGVMHDPYEYVGDAPNEWKHRRGVDWRWTGREPLPSPATIPIKTVTEVSDRPSLVALAARMLASAGWTCTQPLVVGSQYTRDQIQALVGLTPIHGGPWYTGYVRHAGAWFLFPNIGTPGRTGHDYRNQWEGDRLRWYGKTNTNVNQPEMQAMLAPGAQVHLFSRGNDRDPFTYHGLVRPAQVVGGTPVEVVWEPSSTAPSEPQPLAEEIESGATYREGAATTVTVNAYERNPRARAACLAHYGFNCSVCGICLEDRYGPIAEDFIHVHHLRSIAEIGEEYEVHPIRDLRPVCPNCHAIIHLANPPRSIDEVKAMLR